MKFGGKTISTLGYADDAALLDRDIVTASARVTSIAQGSRTDADMVISIDKTEGMHVREQGRVPRATAAEAAAVCKEVCPHPGCNRVFLNTHGMKCHADKCRWRIRIGQNHQSQGDHALTQTEIPRSMEGLWNRRRHLGTPEQSSPECGQGISSDERPLRPRTTTSLTTLQSTM